VCFNKSGFKYAGISEYVKNNLMFYLNKY